MESNPAGQLQQDCHQRNKEEAVVGVGNIPMNLDVGEWGVQLVDQLDSVIKLLTARPFCRTDYNGPQPTCRYSLKSLPARRNWA